MIQVSVIICHHKGRTLLINSVQSLLKSKEVEFEIIVATSDETLTELDGVKVVQIKGGPAYKRNVASRFAKGDYIAFFDDDIEATPYTVFYMLEELKKENIGCIFGKLLNMEFRTKYDEAGSYLTSTGFLWARAESGIEDTGQFETIVPVLAGKSAAMMIHRNLFFQVGGFDASYEILGEETDLAWRVWLAGYKVLYVPQSVTYHAFNTKFKSADFYIPRRIYFNGCRNYLSMLLTNLGKFNVIIPVTIQGVVWSMAGVGMLITGKFKAGINIFKGLGYVITHLNQILKKRRKVQATRKISDKELFKFILKNPPPSYYWKRFFHYIATGRHG